MTVPRLEGRGCAQPAPASVDVAAFTCGQLGGHCATPAEMTGRDA